MCFSKSVVNSYQMIPDFVLIVIKRYKRLNKKIAPRIFLSEMQFGIHIFHKK